MNPHFYFVLLPIYCILTIKYKYISLPRDPSGYLRRSIKKWSCFRRFPTDTEDLQDIKWSYDNSNIIAIDTPAVCKLLIYNILGELINKIDIYQNQLGIKNFKISPNGHLYCLGLYDQTLRIYNNISYTCTTIFNHDKDILNNP